MDCVLLRHGIAVDREQWEGTDGDRPLTDRGAKRVEQVASGLKWLEIQPTHVLTSPLVRAMETAKIIHTSLKGRSALQVVNELLPDAAPEQLLTLLSDLPRETSVLCVGHEPHLSLTASLMLAGKPSMSFPFKKAGACLIEMPTPLKPSRGTLRWWMGPSQLRALRKKGSKVPADW
ncbi:phosphohistidine phosphatase SixA [Nitrospira sp. KM1]|uniref:phosphohistidine phosphatase SixA n=1 Tax=Nitrospira sp. KM1 TaxID=1936990 RepID=UPI0013A75EFC|nr:phosphohistidine phosphatase SixA [Nitrospira sp. KM1]BCA53131.1 phosphohistidine phosphatase SixA [Nitrospira sp. KM1]